MTEFDPLAILRTLVAHRVSFVVSGGLAATFHGAEQTTGDVDIVYSGEPDNLRRLATALEEMGAHLRGHSGTGVTASDLPAVLATSDLWRWHTSHGDLDMILKPSGAPQYSALRERSVLVDIGDAEVAIAGLGDLIAMKRTTSRPRDRLKLIELEDLKAVQDEPPGDNAG